MSETRDLLQSIIDSKKKKVEFLENQITDWEERLKGKEKKREKLLKEIAEIEDHLV